MNVPELHVHPEVTGIPWREFIATHPPRSIALDGYVKGKPNLIRNSRGIFANMDHHAGVDRLASWSSAMQVVMKANSGFVEAFSHNGVFAPQVYVNDCDQDVCLAWWLLSHIGEVRHGSNPMLRKITHVAGIIDSTNGAFPFDPNEWILRRLAWVFEPYSLFRQRGGLANPTVDSYRDVINNVGGRLTAALHGHGHEIEIDYRYNIIGPAEGWTMFEEVGAEGRRAAFASGIQAYVIAQALPNGKYWYSIGRISEAVDFPCVVLRRRLSELEPEGTPPWGGNSIIGGCPRPGGSSLEPQVVYDTICEELARRQKRSISLNGGKIGPLERWIARDSLEISPNGNGIASLLPSPASSDTQV